MQRGSGRRATRLATLVATVALLALGVFTGASSGSEMIVPFALRSAGGPDGAAAKKPPRKPPAKLPGLGRLRSS
jgi:hypothetical protein